MTSQTPPPPTLSAFTPVRGGFSEAIAPGPQLVTLGAGATWWAGDTAVTAALPPGTPVDGSRWTRDGASLRVGLGTLDLAARTWRPDPAFEVWTRRGPRGESPVRAVAWFPDVNHVAMLREVRTREGTRRTEIVVVSAADGKERGRRELEGASQLIAAGDRLLVAARSVVVLDLDASVIATPAALPLSVFRVREGAGRFAAVGAAGAVALLNPADGAVLGTWDIAAIDAVPVSGGVVAIDFEGIVRVGCLEGDAIRGVAERASGVRSAILQVVGDRLVVAGAGADPVRVATFVSPCR